MEYGARLAAAPAVLRLAMVVLVTVLVTATMTSRALPCVCRPLSTRPAVPVLVNVYMSACNDSSSNITMAAQHLCQAYATRTTRVVCNDDDGDAEGGGDDGDDTSTHGITE